MKKIIGLLFLVILLIMGQVVWADETLRTMVQSGHVSEITSITFSRDGNLIASADENNNIKLWRTSDGRLINTWNNNANIKLMTFNSNGLIVTLGKGILNFWEPSSGSLIRKIENKTLGDISDLSESYVATVENKEVIKIWKLSDMKLFRTFVENGGRISSIAISQDGHFLAYLYNAHERVQILKIYQVVNGSLIKSKVLPDIKKYSPSITITHSIAFSQDGNFLVLGGENNVKIWRTSNWNLAKALEVETDESAFSPGGNLLFTRKYEPGMEENSLRIWRVSDWTFLKEIQWDRDGSFAFSPDEQLIVVGEGGGYHGSGVYYYPTRMRVYNISTDEVKEIYKEGEAGQRVESAAFNKDQEYIAIRGNTDLSVENNIKLFKVTNGNLVWEKNGDELDFSPDGRYLATRLYDEINIWHIPDGNLIQKIKFDGIYNRPNHPLKYSPDGQFIASYDEGDSLMEYVIKLWRVSDGTLIKTFRADGLWRIDAILFSPDGNSLAALSGNLIFWRVSDGNLIIKINSDPINGFSFSQDGQFLEVFGKWPEGDVRRWRVSDGQMVETYKKDEGLFLSLIGNLNLKDRLHVENMNESAIALQRNGQLLATLFPFPNSSVTLTPEGFFSGSGDFNKYVHFVRGLEVYDFNQFYDAFYRPDLVEKKLKGEDITKYVSGLNINNAVKNPPPQVTILSPKEDAPLSERTVTVKVQIKDTGGGIGDIRVHHNGKFVDSLGVYRYAKTEVDDKQKKIERADIENPYQTAKRGTSLRRVWEDKEKKDIRIVDFTPTKGNVEKTYNITLIKGENTVSVSAFNGTNTVMSAMESIKIKADIPEKKPELFVLSIGNNNFANPSYNLKMAIKDSKDLSEIIKKVASPLYEKINIRALTDTNKASIIEVITSISSQMNPEDIFIFFAATHGRAEDDLYYLYTSDFNGDIRNPKNYISSIEIMELSKKIPALKQVFVLDTCQSGGIETIVSGLYDARISVLAKSLGMHIFAGTKTFQEAQDDYKGNGLFTHFVLNGLKGEADENHNKDVTVFEMNPYLTKTVKEASHGSQEPFIRNFGDDLPISKVLK